MENIYIVNTIIANGEGGAFDAFSEYDDAAANFVERANDISELDPKDKKEGTFIILAKYFGERGFKEVKALTETKDLSDEVMEIVQEVSSQLEPLVFINCAEMTEFQFLNVGTIVSEFIKFSGTWNDPDSLYKVAEESVEQIANYAKKLKKEYANVDVKYIKERLANKLSNKVLNIKNNYKAVSSMMDFMKLYTDFYDEIFGICDEFV